MYKLYVYIYINTLLAMIPHKKAKHNTSTPVGALQVKKPTTFIPFFPSFVTF